MPLDIDSSARLLIGNGPLENRQRERLRARLSRSWRANTVHSEVSLHQVSPYIGRLKSSVAAALIQELTRTGQTVYDPFSGAGTVPLEAWRLSRHTIANDLNPYATTLARAKLNPPEDLSRALSDLQVYKEAVKDYVADVDLRSVPSWVRSFFHRETLREAIAWARMLREKNDYFTLACLLGILHHQRSGFLSFPSSHAVPYLRLKRFPPPEYPKMYEYRDVYSRLERKVRRTLARLGEAPIGIERAVFQEDARVFTPPRRVDCIITSPPYMAQLDYGRDNRLRLWFLGLPRWEELDKRVSPSEKRFFEVFRDCLHLWKQMLPGDGYCALVLGNAWSKTYDADLASAVIRLATDVGGYRTVLRTSTPIPRERRVRRNYVGSTKESVLVLQRDG